MTERYCRHRSPEDRAATLIRIKDRQVRDYQPSPDLLTTLQAMESLLELDRQIVALGYSPDLPESEEKNLRRKNEI